MVVNNRYVIVNAEELAVGVQNGTWKRYPKKRGGRQEVSFSHSAFSERLHIVHQDDEDVVMRIMSGSMDKIDREYDESD